MSTGTALALTVGVLAAGGAVAYVVYKRRQTAAGSAAAAAATLPQPSIPQTAKTSGRKSYGELLLSVGPKALVEGAKLYTLGPSAYAATVAAGGGMKVAA